MQLIRTNCCRKRTVNIARIVGNCCFPNSVADLTAHLINQIGQFAANVYGAVNPAGFNSRVVVAVLICALTACLMELALEYFHPVHRRCLLHDMDPIWHAHLIPLDPLPPPQANARLQQMAAWLSPLPQTLPVPLPTPPSLVYLQDDESRLENTNRRMSDETDRPPQSNVIELEDKNGEASDIELEELSEEEQE